MEDFRYSLTPDTSCKRKGHSAKLKVRFARGPWKELLQAAGIVDFPDHDSVVIDLYDASGVFDRLGLEISGNAEFHDNFFSEELPVCLGSRAGWKQRSFIYFVDDADEGWMQVKKLIPKKYLKWCFDEWCPKECPDKVHDMEADLAEMRKFIPRSPIEPPPHAPLEPMPPLWRVFRGKDETLVDKAVKEGNPEAGATRAAWTFPLMQPLLERLLGMKAKFLAEQDVRAHDLRPNTLIVRMVLDLWLPWQRNVPTNPTRLFLGPIHCHTGGDIRRAIDKHGAPTKIIRLPNAHRRQTRQPGARKGKKRKVDKEEDAMDEGEEKEPPKPAKKQKTKVIQEPKPRKPKAKRVEQPRTKAAFVRFVPEGAAVVLIDEPPELPPLNLDLNDGSPPIKREPVGRDIFDELLDGDDDNDEIEIIEEKCVFAPKPIAAPEVIVVSKADIAAMVGAINGTLGVVAKTTSVFFWIVLF